MVADNIAPISRSPHEIKKNRRRARSNGRHSDAGCPAVMQGGAAEMPAECAVKIGEVVEAAAEGDFEDGEGTVAEE